MKFKYYVKSKEGECFGFISLKHLCHWIDESFYHLGHCWNDTWSEMKFPLTYYTNFGLIPHRVLHNVDYVVYDEYWRVVSIELLKEFDKTFDRNSYNPPSWVKRHNERLKRKAYEFRNGPVPGVHKWSCHRRHRHLVKAIRDMADQRKWKRKLHFLER
jgi:hypothetical protein